VARFERRAWKYASTAYSNTVKNAGVLVETIGLVATSLGRPVLDGNAACLRMLARSLPTDGLEEAPVAAVLVA
jgi:hypothetical protein